MDFDVNFNNKPIIQEAKSMHNDGGAGNLGYFERGEKEENSEKASIFSDDADSFKKAGQNDVSSEGFSIARLIAQIILAIKEFFRKILKLN